MARTIPPANNNILMQIVGGPPPFHAFVRRNIARNSDPYEDKSERFLDITT